MSSARVARRAAALRSASRKTIGSGEAGRAAGGDLTGFGAGAGAGAATTAGLFTERRAADGDFAGVGAGTGAGTGAGAGATTGTGRLTARRAVRPL